MPDDCPTWWSFTDGESDAQLACCQQGDGTLRTRVTTYGAETTYQWYFSERTWVGYSSTLHFGTPSCCDGVDVYSVSAGDIDCGELTEGDACWQRPSSDSRPSAPVAEAGCGCATATDSRWSAWTLAGLLLLLTRRRARRRPLGPRPS